MNEKDRKSIHRALRRALPYLWNGKYDHPHWDKDTYVCNAVSNGNNNSAASTKARRVIAARIAPYGTVDDWLLHHGVKNPTKDIEILQDYRKRWLESMIEEFAPTKV